MREEVLNWLKQAEADLRTAENSFKSKDFYACVFWCQQAAEKAIKSFILLKNKENIMGHSLIYLGKEARLPNEFFSGLRRLSPQYIISRYPDASEGIPSELYDVDISKEFLGIAKKVLEWIRNHSK